MEAFKGALPEHFWSSSIPLCTLGGVLWQFKKVNFRFAPLKARSHPVPCPGELLRAKLPNDDKQLAPMRHYLFFQYGKSASSSSQRA